VTRATAGDRGDGRRVEVAVGAVIEADDSLLLVRRGRHPEMGRWSIPGGRVEPGETLAEAVEREVLEETALVASCGRFVGWVERIGAGHHFVILDFTASLPSAACRPDPAAGGDVTEACWVRLSEVPTYDLVSGLEDFLREHGVLPGRYQAP